MLRNLNSRFELIYALKELSSFLSFILSFFFSTPCVLGTLNFGTVEFESWTVQEERFIHEVTSTQGIPWLPCH